jgi:signal transduction histidine kinase
MGKKRAKLEKLFAEREQELKVLSDHCPSGIVRLDAAGYITYANDAFRQSSGISAELSAADMSTVWNLLCDEETAERLARVWPEILYGESETMEVRWKWRTTGRTMLGVFIRLDKVRPGMSGVIGCVLEAERRRVMAEESRRQQEMLVDFTSHEIRTPVSAILQCSSLVKENLVAHRQQLSAKACFTPTPQLLSQLEDDIDALESRSATLSNTNLRHLPVRSPPGANRRRRAVARAHPARSSHTVQRPCRHSPGRSQSHVAVPTRGADE